MKGKFNVIFYFSLIWAMLSCSYAAFAQFPGMNGPVVETINDAKAQGITIDGLDARYKSAVHIDTSKAVFKTQKEKDSLINAYTAFLQGLGNYLSENNFKWRQPTRCWNRIYFGADGAVEYYLFDFRTDLGSDKVKRFKELFRSYAATHKIGISAQVGFAQCSPVTYVDK